MPHTSALGPATVISMEGPAKTRIEGILRGIWRAGLALLVMLVLVLAWLVAFGNLYTPGSKLGYNLGLAGGLMILSLLLYPLRKRVPALNRLGHMETWFRYHMFIGIGGPVLILFHSTFKTGSMNGSIALYAMLLVALSGVIGRFVYRHIHRGLYGREVTLTDAEADLKASLENMGSVFSLRPEIEQQLKAFHQSAFARLNNIPHRAWRFMTIRWRGKRLIRTVRRDAKKALAQEALQQQWSRAQLLLNYGLAKKQINRYVDAIVQSSQLAGWERLFSLWHLGHIPFLYLLLLSGIVHVIAVHLY
jgi:hypothetical protein